MKIGLNVLVAALGLAAASLAQAQAQVQSQAQDYPQRPVKLLVPLAPASAIDIVARLHRRQDERSPRSERLRGGPAGGGGTDRYARSGP